MRHGTGRTLLGRGLPVAVLVAALGVAGHALAATGPAAGAHQAAAADDTSGFYVDPDSNSATWVRNNGGDPRAAAIQASIAERPAAKWFGDWSGDITSAVSGYVGAAATAGKLPVIVAYDIYDRDCNGASSGGAASPDAYRTWIAGFAAGIGDRPAVVVVEPDALAQLDCLPSDTDRQNRLDLLKYATQQLAAAPNARSYLDAGNANWIAADTMAQRLDAGGVSAVRGFAVNVSNFYTTDQSTAYSASVNASLSSRYGYTRQFVVDTSRNGNGSNGEWCNPAGRELGTPSTTGGTGGAELLLWIKDPGDSDGPCGTAPSTPAGTFSPDLATNLINGT
jgi:endoglucanase